MLEIKETQMIVPRVWLEARQRCLTELLRHPNTPDEERERASQELGQILAEIRGLSSKTIDVEAEVQQEQFFR